MRTIFKYCLLVTLTACASQEAHFVPFDRTDYQMDVSFQSVRQQETGQWLIIGQVTDREYGGDIPNVFVAIAESQNVDLSKMTMENSALRTVTYTDRKGYFEIRSADIRPDDVILFRFIGHRDKVYSIRELLKTQKGERH